MHRTQNNVLSDFRSPFSILRLFRSPFSKIQCVTQMLHLLQYQIKLLLTVTHRKADVTLRINSDYLRIGLIRILSGSDCGQIPYIYILYIQRKELEK
jgi:hypothetical protein